jgi:hypothetical protein
MKAPGMGNALVPTPGSEGKSLEKAAEAAADFIAASQAENTRRAPESLSKKAAQYTPRIFARSRFLVPITFNPGAALAAVPSAFSGGAVALAQDLASAEQYAAGEKSEATRKAYRSDWKHFSAWCDRSWSDQVCNLPATSETVAVYIAHLADTGRSASTISRRLAAIAYAHKLKGLDPPTGAETVRAVNRGIRRKIGTKTVQKAPVTAGALSQMLSFVGTDLAGHPGRVFYDPRERQARGRSARVPR